MRFNVVPISRILKLQQSGRFSQAQVLNWYKKLIVCGGGTYCVCCLIVTLICRECTCGLKFALIVFPSLPVVRPSLLDTCSHLGSRHVCRAKLHPPALRPHPHERDQESARLLPLFCPETGDRVCVLVCAYSCPCACVSVSGSSGGGATKE